MSTYQEGPYNIEIEVYGVGPFKARGFVRSMKFGRLMKCVDTAGEHQTSAGAEEEALGLARTAAHAIPYDRKHVD